MRLFYLITCALLLMFSTIVGAYHSKVHPTELSSIVLDSSKNTAGIRQKVPQMLCTGPNYLCKQFEKEITTAFCENIWFDGVDIRWKCTSDLPSAVKFKSTTVACEGFEFPEDIYLT